MTEFSSSSLFREINISINLTGFCLASSSGSIPFVLYITAYISLRLKVSSLSDFTGFLSVRLLRLSYSGICQAVFGTAYPFPQ